MLGHWFVFNRRGNWFVQQLSTIDPSNIVQIIVGPTHFTIERGLIVSTSIPRTAPRRLGLGRRRRCSNRRTASVTLAQAAIGASILIVIVHIEYAARPKDLLEIIVGRAGAVVRSGPRARAQRRIDQPMWRHRMAVFGSVAQEMQLVHVVHRIGAQ